MGLSVTSLLRATSVLRSYMFNTLNFCRVQLHHHDVKVFDGIELLRYFQHVHYFLKSFCR